MEPQDSPVERLAAERTRLSEERTYLAYIRTGMSLILGGIFFIGYFPEGSIFSYIGYATIGLSVLFSCCGFYHHKKSKEIIDRTLGLLGLNDRH
ncbi:MAG: DUF202 domain-containing protein [Candidatus Micrarchaeota archaeon]